MGGNSIPVQPSNKALGFLSLAHHDYLIRYSNGFKRHVSRAERDILMDSLEQTGPREYLSTANIQTTFEQTSGPSFLPGQFIFELRGKKHSELMQSVQGLVRELEHKPMQMVT